MSEAKPPTSASEIPPHRDADAVRPVTVGTILWAIAFVILLTQRSKLQEHNTEWWLWTCVAGFGLGLVGLWFVRRRRAAYARAGRSAG